MNEWMKITEIFLKLEKNIDKLEQYISDCNVRGIIPRRDEILKGLQEIKEIAVQGENYSKEEWL